MKNSKKALKRGEMRYYFPNHPEHKLNGCFAHGTGPSTGTMEGKKTRDLITTFEGTESNYATAPGLWEDELRITADDFDSDVVLVKQWFSDGFGIEPEYFYLTN